MKIKPADISDGFVAMVEEECGMGSNAWDCVDPKDIIAAVLNIQKLTVDEAHAWIAERRTEPVAEVEKNFNLPPGSLRNLGTINQCPHCNVFFGEREIVSHVAGCEHAPNAPL